jgi:two-component system sensor histidine kinase CpxA
MKSLFARIFLWFWITGTITLLASVSVIVFEHHAVRPSSPLILEDTSRFFGTTVADVLEESGREAAKIYLLELSKNTRMEGCLFDEEARPLVGERCAEVQDQARLVSAAGDNKPLGEGERVENALGIQSASKRNYIFVSQAATGSRLSPTYELGTLALRALVAVVASGVVCLLLARYLTRPILRLRTATQRVAAGQLDARVEGGVARNGDDLAGLACDFNSMADQIQALVTSQRQLLYDISHELRSPLARINVALDTLRSRSASEPLLVRIETDLRQLNEMIGRILTVAKLETNSGLASFAPVSLMPLIESIAYDADFEAQERETRVQVVEGDEAMVNGDPGLLRSAIENVVRNAVRFTAPGTSVEIRFRVRNTGEQPRARLSVRDYGPGVAEEDLRNIFKPFYRVTDSGSRNTEGVGLGLAITDKIIRLHGGTTSATNMEKGGLQVEIELPIAASDIRDVAAIPEVLPAEK